MISTLMLLAVSIQAAPATKPTPTESAPPAVVEWFRARAHATDDLVKALSTTPHAESSGAASHEASPAASAAPRIVVVGRAFEGTHELVAFERELVARAEHVDVVAFDVGLIEGEAADRYVHTGEGDPIAIAATFGPWGWSTSEAADVLKALRERTDKPVVAGIGVGSPKQPCELALKFIDKLSPSFTPRSELVLAPMRTDGVNGRPRYYQLTENQRGILRYGVVELHDLLVDQQEQLADKAQPAEFARCLQLLRAIRQYEETMRFELEAADEDPRGRLLAQNLIDVVSARPANARVLVFARLRDLGRVGDPTSFPALLRSIGGLESTCIATACGEATFRAYDPNDHVPGPLVARDVVATADACTLLEGALRAAASASEKGPCWFDLRHAAIDGDAKAWFTAHRRTLRSSGPWCGGAIETPWDFDVLRDFEGIVWFPKVTVALPAPAVVTPPVVPPVAPTPPK